MKKRIFSVMTSLILVVSMLAVVPSITVSAGNGLYWPVPGHTNLSQGYHSGYCIDINDGSIAGATIVAAKGGTVYKKYTCTSQHSGSSHTCDGFGTGIIIKGDDGRYYGYAHMQGGSIPSNVYAGAYVSGGQKIGQVGKTGNATGNHLHFYCGKSAWKGDIQISKNASDYDGGGGTNVPSIGTPYTTSVGSNSAYIKCDIGKNGSNWSVVGAYYGTTSACTTHAGSDNLGSGNSWAGYTLSNLSAGTTYYYKFYINANGTTYWSSVRSFTTPNPTGPSIGTPYTTSVGSNSAYIKCDIGKNGSNWSVVGAYYGTTTACSIHAGSDNLGTGNSWAGYTLSNLALGTTYYYKFYINANGTTYWSSVQSFKTPGTVQAPYIGTPYTTSIGDNSAYIKCDIGKNGSGWSVVGAYYGTTSACSTHAGSDNLGTINSWAGYTLKNLAKGTKYYYKFYINANGTTYWSSVQSFTTTGYVNLGNDFSAVVLNNHCWKPILQEDNGNVALGTESKNNYDRTLWHFVRNSNGSYTISSYYGGVLDVNNAADADGTNVQVWSNNGGTAQQWYIIEDNGAYLLRAACTSRVLDVNGMATADGTNVQTWSSNGTEAQRFAIYKMNSERDKLNYSIESSKTSVSKNETVDITVGGQIGYVYNYKFHVLMPNGEEQVINNKSLRNYSLNCTQVGKYVVWAEIKNPLYTECGSATNKAVTINVTCTHKYTTTVVAPTATAQGYTLHKCSICGNSYKDNYTEKLALDNVTGFKATATTASSVSFTWNKVSNASGYIVYREIDGKWKGVGTPTSNKFTDTPLSSNKEYKYAIRAYKKLEDGSKKYSASMVQLTAHTCLINCSNFKSTSETKAISFTWNAVKDATGYIMYKKIDGVWTGIGTPRTTSFTDTEGLYSGCTYQYAIRAYKKLADGTKIYSESLKTLETSTRPVTTTFTLTAGTKKVDISWVKTAGATSYKVYYKTASSGDWIELSTVDKNTFSYTKSGLTSGKTYWFTVKAVRTVNGRTYNGNFAKKSVTVK